MGGVVGGGKGARAWEFFSTPSGVGRTRCQRVIVEEEEKSYSLCLCVCLMGRARRRWRRSAGGDAVCRALQRFCVEDKQREAREANEPSSQHKLTGEMWSSS